MTAEPDRRPQIVIEPLLLDVKMTAAVCSLSVRGLERLLARGCFPKPLRPGGSRLRRWRREDLVEWISDGCGNQERRAISDE